MKSDGTGTGAGTAGRIGTAAPGAGQTVSPGSRSG